MKEKSKNIQLHLFDKVRSQKILIIIGCISLAVIMCITSYIKIFGKSNNIDSVYAADISEYDWALYNYGQTIEGSKGIDGIDINIIPAWEITRGSTDIVVGVVDTGVDYSCKILQGKLIVNEKDPIDSIDNDGNGYIDDFYGWDYYNNDNTIYDDYLYDYHGTYIATTILKVAPEVNILPVKFLKSTTGSAEDGILAIKYAISNGACIINCSWNFYEYDHELYEIIANNPDVLFVCAAGNSNMDLDNENIYPCSYDLDNIISVMAIDNLGNAYNASGYGENVDIAAPGEKVLVTFPEDDETYINGTSVATAFVSAAAALILSVDNTLTPSEVKNIIISSSNKLETLNSLCYAEGYIDIYNSLLNINK